MLNVSLNLYDPRKLLFLHFGKIQREKMGLGQEGGKVWSVNLVCSPKAKFFIYFLFDFYQKVTNYDEFRRERY